jgi:hypothetical protein
MKSSVNKILVRMCAEAVQLEDQGAFETVTFHWMLQKDSQCLTVQIVLLHLRSAFEV